MHKAYDWSYFQQTKSVVVEAGESDSRRPVFQQSTRHFQFGGLVDK